jgi:hypothetical protein
MSRLSRAQFLTIVGSALPGWALSRSLAAFQASVADRRRRVSDFISTYDGQGSHRTATIVDNASADWLRQLAIVAGAEARLIPFALQQVEVRAAYLEADGQRIEGVPFFDGGFTGETGIVGTLGAAGSTADIALVTLDSAAISSEGQSIAALRRSEPHRAIVAVTTGASPGLALSNAGSFAAPYGIPVLQVASEHQSHLSELAVAGRRITLVAAASRVASQALNVVATVAGRQPSLAPLVVMTPRSGWWQCASERGGGLACWMETIRAVVAAKGVRPAIFVASSGHELGHYGLEAFLQQHPGLIKDAAAWIHLGANIGAAGGQVRLQASDDESEARAVRGLREANAVVQQRVPRGTLPAGEARNIHAGGGRYVSLVGSGPAFHTPQDRWPAAVDLDSVVRFAQASSIIATGLVS